jgi:hypothetical protein
MRGESKGGNVSPPFGLRPRAVSDPEGKGRWGGILQVFSKSYIDKMFLIEEGKNGTPFKKNFSGG